jgi:hypothetical protein
MTFSTDSQRRFFLAWHASLPAGLADRLCRGAGHQSAHGSRHLEGLNWLTMSNVANGKDGRLIDML